MTQTDKTLSMDTILARIEPSGELGNTYKRKLVPYRMKDTPIVRAAYDRIALLMVFIQRQKGDSSALREHLAHCKELRNLLSNPEIPLALHECQEIKEFVYNCEKIRILCQINALPLKDDLPVLTDLFKLLDPEDRRVPHFHLSGKYSAKLKRTMDLLAETHSKIAHSREQRLQQAREALGLPGLKAEIVVSRMQDELVKELSASPFFGISAENYANLTFTLSSTPQMMEYMKQTALLKEELSTTEAEVLRDLSDKISQYAYDLAMAQTTIATLDWEYACAGFGVTHQCSIPQLNEKMEIMLIDAVNLPVLDFTRARGKSYQKLGIALKDRINVLTGPNMGGKTTTLKTIGQICRLASLAIPLPCREAHLPVFDWIWYNQDDTGDENLSTFAREIVSFSRALTQKGKGLILLDEFAKGTNPTEGEQIAAAVLEYLEDDDRLVFSATHFNAPAMLENAACFAVKGIDDAWFDNSATIGQADLDARLKMLNQAMDYEIVRLPQGQLPPRCAIRIARILGMPQKIINKLEN